MNEMKFYVDFGTGAGNFYAESLEKAMEAADEEAAYTQQDIKIYAVDENGNINDTPEMGRRWWEYEYRPEEDSNENPIVFGTFGFYSDWHEVEPYENPIVFGTYGFYSDWC